MTVSDQTLKELGMLSLKLAANEKTRPTYLKSVKQVDPSFRLPADVQIAEFKTEQKAERDRERLEQQTRQINNRLAKQRKELIDSGRFTEEQVKEIETKVMPRYGLSDYDAGAKLYAADLAPAKPRESGQRHGRIWEFPSLPGLLENPERAANDAAYAVIDELRARR